MVELDSRFKREKSIKVEIAPTGFQNVNYMDKIVPWSGKL